MHPSAPSLPTYRHHLGPSRLDAARQGSELIPHYTHHEGQSRGGHLDSP